MFNKITRVSTVPLGMSVEKYEATKAMCYNGLSFTGSLSKIRPSILRKATFEATIAWTERKTLGRTFRPCRFTR